MIYTLYVAFEKTNNRLNYVSHRTMLDSQKIGMLHQKQRNLIPLAPL